MARLHKGKQKVAFGCYYTLEPGEKLMDVKIKIDIKWYGLPFLMWRTAHKDYDIRWYQYPWLLYLITKHSVLGWIGRYRKGGGAKK